MSDHKKQYFEYPERPANMRYCSECVYPASSASALVFDEDGVCSGCRVAAQREDIDWDARFKRLERLVERFRSKDGSNMTALFR